VPRPLAKSILSPRLIYDERNGICQIEAAVAGAHGNRQALLAGNRIDHGWRQASGLRPEKKRIPGTEPGVAVAQRGASLHAEYSRAAEGGEAGVEIGVHHDRGKLCVVETRTAYSLVAQVEVAGFDEVQGAARVGA